MGGDVRRHLSCSGGCSFSWSEVGGEEGRGEVSADEGLRCGVEVGRVGERVLKGRGLRREGGTGAGQRGETLTERAMLKCRDEDHGKECSD